MRRRKRKANLVGTATQLRVSRIEELASIIAERRSQLSMLNTTEVELHMKLNKLQEKKSDVNSALIAAYREMDKQVAGPVLNR